MQIGELIRALQLAGLQVNFRELRELLWLAPRLTEKPVASPAPADATSQHDAVQAAQGTPAATPKVHSEARQILAQVLDTDAANHLELYGAAAGSRDGTAARRVQLRGMPALPQALAIGRALRPLSRRRLGNHLVLDERATAEFIAEARFHAAVFRPALERWFDIVVAVEEVASLAAWRPLVMELERMLRRQGGFRSVRSFRLQLRDTSVTALGPDGYAVPAHALQDRLGRRIILVVSDCTSAAWRRGYMGEWLEAASRGCPAAVVQLLPQSMWPNTATGFAELRTKSPRIGAPTSQSMVRRPSWAEGEPGIAMPVLALEPASVAEWALMVTGAGDAWSRATLVPIDCEELDKATVPASLSATARAAVIRASTTPEAQQLAAYFSVVRPLTPPVMRVIHQAMSPHSGAVALAQVFLGGILFPVGAPGPGASADEVEYDFYPGLRNLFADVLTRRQFLQVNLALHDFLKQQSGTPFDFFALLEDPGGNERLPAAALPFVQFARSMAHRFGGGRPRPANSVHGVGRLSIAQEGNTLTFQHDNERGTLTLRHDIPGEAAALLASLRLGNTREDFNALARMVVPIGLQDSNAIANGPDFIELLLDSAAAVYPWEAMFTGIEPSTLPLAVARGMTRHPLKETLLREHPGRASGALTIGDPASGDSRFTQLPGARREAQRIADLLGSVTDRVRLRTSTSWADIVSALHEQPWRVLHIAAHSVLEAPGNADEATSDDHPGRRLRIPLDGGQSLSIQDFRAMTTMPELIFLGCHHGAELALELMDLGARVVVAPVGSIDDEAATSFAIAFFEKLAGGAPLIEAMRHARRYCLEKHPADDIWGQFECYGEPGWLLMDTPVSAASSKDLAHAIEEHAPARSSNSKQQDTPGVAIDRAAPAAATHNPTVFQPLRIAVVSGVMDEQAGNRIMHLVTRLGHHPLKISMLLPLSETLSRAGQCDILICLFGWDDGPVPRNATLNPDGKSQLELAYLAASGQDKAVRFFVLDEGIAPTSATSGRFKEQVLRDHPVKIFASLDQLEAVVEHDIANLALSLQQAALTRSSPITGAETLARERGPDSSWVLVAGSAGLPLDDKVARTCELLGASLARAGFGLVTGRWPGVDTITAGSFAEALDAAGIAVESRLVQVMATGETPTFPRGQVVRAENRELERTARIDRAASVVLIGGAVFTIDIAEHADAAHRLLLPLKDTGGAAEIFHQRMVRMHGYRSAGGPLLDMLSLPAPEVIHDLMLILEERRALDAPPARSQDPSAPA